MEMLFSQEEVWEQNRREIANEARREGEACGESKRDALYGELLKILEPLGRIGDTVVIYHIVHGAADYPKLLKILLL